MLPVARPSVLAPEASFSYKSYKDIFPAYSFDVTVIIFILIYPFIGLYLIYLYYMVYTNFCQEKNLKNGIIVRLEKRIYEYKRF